MTITCTVDLAEQNTDLHACDDIQRTTYVNMLAKWHNAKIQQTNSFTCNRHDKKKISFLDPSKRSKKILWKSYNYTSKIIFSLVTSKV